MFVQTEITPNPNSLKFLPGKKVSNDVPIEITDKNNNLDEDSIEFKMDSLKSMLNKELITEDEYNEKKKDLLDKL